MAQSDEIHELAALLTVVPKNKAGVWAVVLNGVVMRSDVFGVSAGSAKIAAARTLHQLGWRAVKS